MKHQIAIDQTSQITSYDIPEMPTITATWPKHKMATHETSQMT
jgi:hypothetical protein